MNDQPDKTGQPLPAIPSAERPREQVDVDLERLEESTLDKQARSASYRDALERKQHLDSLNRRIDVLQQKLDCREADFHRVLPKLAQLEQAEQVSKVLVRDGTIICAIGGAFISGASLFAEGFMRLALAGLGTGLLVCGLWICKLLNVNVWPSKSRLKSQNDADG